MEKRERPIAVFDSGVGGISVLKELIRQMPGERFLYYGDSANAPYGVRPTEQVRALTLQRVEELMARGVKAVVIACNTATSAAIEDLRRLYPDEIIVGIEPAVKLAAELRPEGRILVMATPVTLREHKFKDLMERFSGQRPVEALPCPGLVELVEAGKTGGPQVEDYLHRVLVPVLGKDTAAIVLGCTHYPFARKTVEKVAGAGISVIDGGGGTARETKRRLEQAGLLWERARGEITLESSRRTPEELELMERLLETE